MPTNSGFSVIVRTDRLAALIRQMPGREKAAVNDTAQAIRGRANQQAPRDTGSLAESLYVNNSDGDSDYAQRAGSARARNREAVIVQEVRPEFVLSLVGTTANAFSSVVGAAVAHGIYQELGTVHMGAQPFLIPAIEASSDEFVTAMSHVADV